MRQLYSSFKWILACFFILFPWMSYAQVFQQWVQRHSSGGWDAAQVVATDSAGNVYVTGYSTVRGSNYHYVTVKYSASGNLLWSRTYIGPGNASDLPNAMVVDGSGNVYVTGQSVGNGTGYDYATIKYDTHGNEMWIRRYNGYQSGTDIAAAIAVDGAGNVYVTGSSGNVLTPASDFVTIKYAAGGDEVWVRRYDWGAFDEAHAIAVDGSGNVYVTGATHQNIRGGLDHNFLTFKYNAAGELQWSQVYNGPANLYDSPSALAVDRGGNVYVTGSSEGIGSGYDYATIKYDATGHTVWVNRYNGPGNGFDAARALAIDSAGNVYVTGSSGDFGPNIDYATIKYDTYGHQLWLARYNGSGGGSDVANSMVLDQTGNIYITGQSLGKASGYGTVKYDNNGNLLWATSYVGPGNGPDDARSVTVDPWGNVYVTGESLGDSTGYDFATVKYTSAGAASGSLHMEAEDFSEMRGVSTEPAVDSGGGLDVGYIDPGDWMAYMLDVPSGGIYILRLRLATPNSAAQLEVKDERGTTLATVSVPNTGDWQRWQTVSTTIRLLEGQQKIRIMSVSTGWNNWNINWLELQSTSLHIEAEDYVVIHDGSNEATTDTGGGLDVGYIHSGSYMDYQVVVPSAGVYSFKVRVATPAQEGQLQLQKTDGTVLATVNVPVTGGWQDWQTVSTSVSLREGVQTLRIYCSSPSGWHGWNINWLAFAPVDAVGARSYNSSSGFAIADEKALPGVYPNPVHEQLQLRVSNQMTGPVQLKLFTMNGVLVKDCGLYKSAPYLETSMWVGSLPKGQYLLVARMQGWSRTYKIVKE